MKGEAVKVSIADRDMRRLIQKRLFQTIAGSLVRQFTQNGIRWSEIVDFVNELLEEILRLQSGAGEEQAGEPWAAPSSDVQRFVLRSQEAQELSSNRQVALNEQVYVRWLADTDKATLSQWQTDPTISESLAIDTIRYILSASNSSNHRGNEDAHLGIYRKTDRRLIGFVGLINVDGATHQAELVKMIGDRSERAKGYARMATRLLLTYGFEHQQLDRIYLRTLGTNLKNIALNQSLGFAFEGLLRAAVRVNGQSRDIVLMALLKRDIEALQGPACCRRVTNAMKKQKADAKYEILDRDHLRAGADPGAMSVGNGAGRYVSSICGGRYAVSSGRHQPARP